MCNTWFKDLGRQQSRRHCIEKSSLRICSCWFNVSCCQTDPAATPIPPTNMHTDFQKGIQLMLACTRVRSDIWGGMRRRAYFHGVMCLRVQTSLTWLLFLLMFWCSSDRFQDISFQLCDERLTLFYIFYWEWFCRVCSIFGFNQLQKHRLQKKLRTCKNLQSVRESQSSTARQDQSDLPENKSSITDPLCFRVRLLKAKLSV